MHMFAVKVFSRPLETFIVKDRIKYSQLEDGQSEDVRQVADIEVIARINLEKRLIDKLRRDEIKTKDAFIGSNSLRAAVIYSIRYYVEEDEELIKDIVQRMWEDEGFMQEVYANAKEHSKS